MDELITKLFLVLGGIGVLSSAFLWRLKTTSAELTLSYISSKKHMSLSILCMGISSFVAYFSGRWSDGQGEILQLPILIFTYAGCIAAMSALIILYENSGACLRKTYRINLPVAVACGLYIIGLIVWDEIPIYTLRQYFSVLTLHWIVVLRTLVFCLMVVSLGFMIFQFHQARNQYVKSLNQRENTMTPATSDLILRMYYYIIWLNVWILLDTFFPSIELDYISLILFLTLYSFIFIWFMRYRRVLENTVHKKRRNSISKNFVEDRYISIIKAWVEDPGKPYLKNALTIDEVSQMLNIKRTILSTCINQSYGTNFNRWINSLRIIEVQQLIEHGDPRLTFTEIADQTGFPDLPTMSKIFKKIKGITPSEFRNQLKLRDNES